MAFSRVVNALVLLAGSTVADDLCVDDPCNRITPRGLPCSADVPGATGSWYTGTCDDSITPWLTVALACPKTCGLCEDYVANVCQLASLVYENENSVTCTDEARASVVADCAAAAGDAFTCATAADSVSVAIAEACSSGRSVAGSGPGRVLVNGDSLLDGLGYTAGAFEAALAEALGTTVENNAVSGACLDLISQQRSCSDVEGCGLLVLNGGHNLCDENSTPDGEVAKMTALVEREVEAGVNVVLVTYPPDPTVTDAQQLQYTEYIAGSWVALAAAHDLVHVVDLRESPSFAPADDTTRASRAEDNSHPSPLGGEAIAAHVAAVVAGGAEDHEEDHEEDAHACYSAPGEVVHGDCACHASCATCGYNAAPTDYRDCITCAEGLCLETVWADPETGELFEYDDGTGWCGPCESDGAAAARAAALALATAARAAVAL